MDDGYGSFAAVYDAWQRVHGLAYSILVAPRVNDRLARWVGRPRLLIDLACGTGTHALLQAQGGTRVIGVDLSEAMLRRAREKVAVSGRPVQLVRADTRTFDGAKPADAVTCLYAALNHLEGAEGLTATFRRVWTHLRPGGVLVFDVNTRQGFEALWRKPTADAGPGFTIRRRFEPDPRGPWSTMYMTIERVANGQRQRASETLRARWFDDGDVRRALEAAGLRPVEVARFNPFPGVEGGAIKQLWTAIRPM